MYPIDILATRSAIIWYTHVAVNWSLSVFWQHHDKLYSHIMTSCIAWIHTSTTTLCILSRSVRYRWHCGSSRHVCITAVHAWHAWAMTAPSGHLCVVNRSLRSATYCTITQLFTGTPAAITKRGGVDRIATPSLYMSLLKLVTTLTKIHLNYS